MEDVNSKFTAWAEGLRLKPYVCPAGKLTIGYGHNLEDNGITEEMAQMILNLDLQQADELLRKHYPTIVQYQHCWKLILRDMMFNLGPKRLAGMKKMLAAIADNRVGEALAEMVDSNWFGQVGQRSKALFVSAWKIQAPSDYIESIGYSKAKVDKDFRECFTKWLNYSDYGQKTNRERFGKRPRIAKWIKAFGLA